MADRVDRGTRSRIMAAVRSKDTEPELALRRRLHALGLRYRLHDRRLPGTPDLVFPRFGAVCFVHGCFWHRHLGCTGAGIPDTRQEFWKAKLRGNVERDRRHRQSLLRTGWRVAIVWECALRSRDAAMTAVELERWLLGREEEFESGRGGGCGEL